MRYGSISQMFKKRLHRRCVQEVVVLIVEFEVIRVKVNNERGRIAHIFLQDVFRCGRWESISIRFQIEIFTKLGDSR